MKQKHILIAILIVFLWGFNFVALKVTVNSLPPVFAAALRFLILSLPWIFFVKKPKISKIEFISIPFSLGVFQYSLLYYGMSLGLSAGLSAVILQTQSFFSVIISSLFMNESIKIKEIIGLIIGALGVLLLFVFNDGDFKFESIIIILFAAISWGIANVQLKNLGNINMVSFLIWISPVAAIFLFFISFYLEFDQIKSIVITDIHISVLLSILYTACISTLLGFSLWQYLLNKYNSVKVTPFGLLVPVTGSIFGVIILNEILEIYQLVSGIIIISGIIMITYKKK